jgi:aminopeptidase N
LKGDSDFYECGGFVRLVFRDQSFSANMNSEALKRIQDVVGLRAAQFPEDAGPLAHPIRPTSCITPSTFYTSTVYSKGAEIIRMLNTLAGSEGYRRGTDLYFSRHDGQAVTCEDFLNCIQETNPSVELSTFPRWYSQFGTPTVTVGVAHDAAANTMTLTVHQEVPKTSKQPDPLPMLIPMRIGLVSHDGSSVLVDDGTGDAPVETKVLILKEESHKFVLNNVPAGTAPSLFRGFSAPVIVKREGGVSQEELAFMMANDDDTFNSWECGQSLALQILQDMIQSDVEVSAFPELPQTVVSAFGKALMNKDVDPSLRAQVLGLPLESFIIESIDVADPVRIRAARQHMRLQLATALKAEFLATLEEASDDADGEYKLDPSSQGRRALKATCLGYLATLEEKETFSRLLDLVRNGSNMTDVLNALSILSCYKTEERETALAEFYDKWQKEPQTILKWFRIQATSPLDGVLDKVKALENHKAFDVTNPNNVYALYGGFAAANMHYIGASAYEWVADAILKVDKLNPQVAARVARSLNRWRKYDDGRQAALKAQFERILATKPSKDVYEVVGSCLEV